MKLFVPVLLLLSAALAGACDISNQYGSLAFEPCDSHTVGHHEGTLLLVSNVTALANITFLFDEKPASPRLWVWRNYSHDVEERVMVPVAQQFTCPTAQYGLINASWAWCYFNDDFFGWRNYTHYFESFNGPTRTIYWTENDWFGDTVTKQVGYFDWYDLSSEFIHHQINGFEAYTYLDAQLQAGKTITAKFSYDTAPGSRGKFDVAVWRSEGTYIRLDPWWDTHDFGWDNTTAFNTGTKSSSEGNYEIETITDNTANAADTLVLGNRFGDNFTFADANGLTWKWELSPVSAIPVTSRSIDTSADDALTAWITSGAYGANYTRFPQTITSDIDMRQNLAMTGGAGNNIHHFVFRIDTSNYIYAYVRQRAVAPTKVLICGSVIAGSSVLNETATTDQDISFRIVRSGSTVYVYYDLAGGDTWTQCHTRGSFPTSAGYIETGVYHGVSAGTTNGTNRNLRVDAGSYGANGYRTTGNWTSPAVTVPAGEQLQSFTLNYTGVDAATYIDEVEFLVAGVDVANYTTDITSGTTITVSTPTGGAFEDVNDSATFNVRVLFVGNGTASPEVTMVAGDFWVPPVEVDEEFEHRQRPPLPETGGIKILPAAVCAACATLLLAALLRRKKRKSVGS